MQSDPPPLARGVKRSRRARGTAEGQLHQQTRGAAEGRKRNVTHRGHGRKRLSQQEWHGWRCTQRVASSPLQITSDTKEPCRVTQRRRSIDKWQLAMQMTRGQKPKRQHRTSHTLTQSRSEARQQPQKLSGPCCSLRNPIHQRLGRTRHLPATWLRTQFVKEACVQQRGRRRYRSARRSSCLWPIGISSTRLSSRTLSRARYHASHRKHTVANNVGWPHSASAQNKQGIS